MKKIGVRMRELRENMGLTLNAVAMYLEIPKKDLEEMECGKKSLTVSLLGKLSDLYGCDKELLLCKSDDFNQTKFALRSESIQVGDLKGIATINKIYKNSIYLNKKYDEVVNKSEN